MIEINAYKIKFYKLCSSKFTYISIKYEKMLVNLMCNKENVQLNLTFLLGRLFLRRGTCIGMLLCHLHKVAMHDNCVIGNLSNKLVATFLRSTGIIYFDCESD